MGVSYNPRIVTDKLGFDVDFNNIKSIDGTTLTDMSGKKIPIILTNSGSATLTVTNGYADFNPANSSSTATYYTISNTYFNDIKSEITIEAAFYVYGDFSVSQSVRGFSTRTTETSAPLGFAILSNGIATELNTTNGWNTAVTTTALSGFNKWIIVSQTTSVASGAMNTYINGQLVKNQPFTGTPNGGNGVLIGRGFYGGVQNYYGRIGFCRVYEKALTSDEIRQNFNAMRGRYGI
jgi:hypothetical protein